MEQHGGDGQAALDRLDNAMVVLDIELMTGFDEDDVGAQLFGVGDDGAGFDAVGLGLVTGGDAAGCVGHHGDDADRAAAQVGPVLLLDGGKVGVEIDEEPVQFGTRLGSLGVERAWGLRGRRSVNHLFNLGVFGGNGEIVHSAVIFAFCLPRCKWNYT